MWYSNEMCCLMHTGVKQDENWLGGLLPLKLSQNKDGNQTPYEGFSAIDLCPLSAIIPHCLKKEHGSQDDGNFILG